MTIEHRTAHVEGVTGLVTSCFQCSELKPETAGVIFESATSTVMDYMGAEIAAKMHDTHFPKHMIVVFEFKPLS